MKLSRTLIAIFAALALITQHVALTHAVWHATPNVLAHDEGTRGASPASDHNRLDSLCAFDAMLGQVLGAGPIAESSCRFAPGASPARPFNLPSHGASHRHHPLSRGPPSLL